MERRRLTVLNPQHLLNHRLEFLISNTSRYQCGDKYCQSVYLGTNSIGIILAFLFQSDSRNTCSVTSQASQCLKTDSCKSASQQAPREDLSDDFMNQFDEDGENVGPKDTIDNAKTDEEFDKVDDVQPKEKPKVEPPPSSKSSRRTSFKSSKASKKPKREIIEIIYDGKFFNFSEADSKDKKRNTPEQKVTISVVAIFLMS